MNRLSVRLIASHVLVAVVGAATAFIVVRLVAPALFDESLRHGQGMGWGVGGPGQGMAQQLREAFASAVDRANLIAALAAVLSAGAVGAFAADRLLGPLRRIGAATRRIAAGHYDERVGPMNERELSALADDVNRLGSALARTEAARVRLLGEVAHEMRTPLTVIEGYAAGMRDGMMPLSGENLEVITGETGRLRRLADDLSALSRSAEHRFELVPRPHELGAVVARASERLRPQAREAGVELVLDLPGTPAPAVVDDARIAQLMTNLIRNALRATPPGGRVTVSVAPLPEGGGTSVSVCDTGVGLAPDDVERVFERFYRVEGTMPGRDGGSGIGLTIARDIARAHGGDLVASSAGLGLGATFVATLPPSFGPGAVTAR